MSVVNFTPKLDIADINGKNLSGITTHYSSKESASNHPKKQTERHQLNLTAKLKQKSVVDKINNIDWENKGSDAPLVVEFDPTTACNLACPDCISRDLLNQKYFSKQRIKDLTMEMVDAGVKAVVLIGGGEPLAHPSIGWVIDYLGNNGVQIGLTTNGLLIERYLDSIAEHVSWTRVSMDAGTKETFGHIRPNIKGLSEFDEAIRNMEALAKVKTGKLGYSFMLYTEEGKFDPNGVDKDKIIASNKVNSNIPEIYDAALIAKNIGCDYFEVKPMYDIHHFSIMQKQALMNEAKRLIEKAETLTDDSFRVLRAMKLGPALNGEGNLEPKDYTRCAVSQLRTLVTPSGTYVCPYFRGSKDKKIGDNMETSFKDMWHSDERKAVMEKLNPATDCKMHCIRHDSNLILEDMIAQQDRIQTIDDFDFFI